MAENHPLLSLASLALAKAGAQHPAYDRSRLRTRSGREINVRDPLAPHLRTVLDKIGNAPQDWVRAVLEIATIFGSDLPRDLRFADALTTAYTQLLRRGARNAAAELI